MSCGCCDNGILWPIASDGDTSRDWIERCDECALYPDDEAAAYALGKRLGVYPSWSYHTTLRRPAPYITRKETHGHHRNDHTRRP